MNSIIKISLVTCLMISASYASQTEETPSVGELGLMFEKGKVSGEIRSVYADYNQKEVGAIDTYATALGGMLKYELAAFAGFNAGFALTTSQDVRVATGDKKKEEHNSELSSIAGNYTELSEAYLNYKNGGLNVRLGRQILDTPLADSDDIRMIPNTFEAYVTTYDTDTFSVTAGNIQSWQGADAGLGYDDLGNKLESNWVDTGDDGMWLGGLSYSDGLEFSAWYYDVSELANATKAIYVDLGYMYELNEKVSIHVSGQYLQESESDKSGVEADIYGASAELALGGLGLNFAYNKSDKVEGKRSFSAYGGGAMYTSMDTMIIDEIADDRDAEAMLLGLTYEVNGWNFFYAYGDFNGDANSISEKAHIIEQNMGFEYSIEDKFVLAALYVMEEDKESSIETANDWERTQIMIKYNF